MKIIKLIFFTMLALGLVVCTGFFIFFQTFDTDQYLGSITKKAALALGRPVSIGHVGLGVSSQGITLDAAPVTIADDAGFTTQPFVKVDRVRIKLDLRSLVLLRQVRITGILLQSPQIHFIRSQDGSINARSIGHANVIASPKGEAISASPVIASEAKQSHNPNEIISDFKTIKIQDGSLSFIDQSLGLPLDIWLKNINADLDDFSFSKPFQIAFNASPCLFKATAPGKLDNPIFRDVTGVVQMNIPNPQITASGDITITDGVIKDFNIIKTILSQALGGFGGLDDSIGKLGTNDTILEKAEAKFSYHNKTLSIDDLLVKTNIFEFTAKGSMDQAFNMDMKTMLHLNADISAGLANELKISKYFMDDSKRIAIGATLKGAIPHLKYKPDKDFKKKSKKAFMAEGGSILGVLLGGR